jgi:hypothetical protein
MKWLNPRFPHLRRQLLDLAKQHLKLRDEPLHLAIAYDPGRDSQDIFLFELLDNFGGNEIDPDAQLFEATFGSSNSFALEAGQRLHLILTNPQEFRTALNQHWPTAEEVRDAVRRGDFEILHSDEIGRDALDLLNELASNSKTILPFSYLTNEPTEVRRASRSGRRPR